jgi:hypothetical protein
LLQKLEVIEMCCTVITFEDLKMLSDIYILLVGDTEIYIFSERVKIKKNFVPPLSPCFF